MSYSLRRGPLGPDEAERLAGACRTLREKRVVWTLLDTGVLVSELVGLTRERISLENYCLYAGICDKADRRGGIRAIPITPRIAPLLGSWFGMHESFGLSARSVQRAVQGVAVRAGIERRVCAEALRHTFAFAAARSGMSPLDLQRLLGHRHLASTEVYFLLVPGGGLIRTARPGGRFAALKARPRLWRRRRQKQRRVPWSWPVWPCRTFTKGAT